MLDKYTNLQGQQPMRKLVPGKERTIDLPNSPSPCNKALNFAVDAGGELLRKRDGVKYSIIALLRP